MSSRKYILVTGGVISGVGKGVIASSLGAILKCCGIEVTAIKIDPYINLDAGTFSPYEHGTYPKFFAFWRSSCYHLFGWNSRTNDVWHNKTGTCRSVCFSYSRYIDSHSQQFQTGKSL